jgi:hypothetical protein
MVMFHSYVNVYQRVLSASPRNAGAYSLGRKFSAILVDRKFEETGTPMYLKNIGT